MRPDMGVGIRFADPCGTLGGFSKSILACFYCAFVAQGIELERNFLDEFPH